MIMSADTALGSKMAVVASRCRCTFGDLGKLDRPLLDEHMPEHGWADHVQGAGGLGGVAIGEGEMPSACSASLMQWA